MEAVRAVADPLRLQILIQLVQPKTAKQVAAALNVPVTRLYYHLKLLEDQSLIRVVGRRQVSGIEEKTYRSVASNWDLAPKLWASERTSAQATSAVVDMVRAELNVAAKSDGGPPGDPTSRIPVLTMTRLALTPAQLEDVMNGLAALIGEFVCTDAVPPEGTELFHFFVAGYRPPAQHPDNAPRV